MAVCVGEKFPWYLCCQFDLGGVGDESLWDSSQIAKAWVPLEHDPSTNWGCFTMTIFLSV